jgi:hypothetical protein
MRRPLRPQTGAHDPQLASMMRLMVGDIAAGCPGGALFSEFLCLALAAHVAQRYGGETPPRCVEGGLSRRQMDAVRDAIEAGLGSELSLVQPAAVAGLGRAGHVGLRTIDRHHASRVRDAVPSRQGAGPACTRPRARGLSTDVEAAARLLHGATLSGKSYDTTPDGRMGWYEYFVRQGHPVYVPDQVGRARSGFNQAVFNDV